VLCETNLTILGYRNRGCQHQVDPFRKQLGLPKTQVDTAIPALDGVLFEDDDIAGRIEFNHVSGVRLVGNRFDRERGRLTKRD
jgi:hypothetical protein